MKNRRAIFGIRVAMAMGLLTPVRRGDDIITIEPTDEAKAGHEALIIGDPPTVEPRRHAGKREAARRLRQIAKRSATPTA